MYVCTHPITWPPHHPELPHHLLAIPRNTRCRQIEVAPARFSTLIAPRGLQSNLSDDVVMGSPPHPWAPDRLRRMAIPRLPAAPFPLCLSPPACFLPPSPPPRVQLSGATGNTRAASPWTLRLEGYPARAALYVCVHYTRLLPCRLLACSLRAHGSPHRCFVSRHTWCHFTSPHPRRGTPLPLDGPFGPEAASLSPSGPLDQNR